MADSIYALGTPIGRSAVAVIRVSGSGFSKGFEKFLNIPIGKKGSWLRSLDLGGFSDRCLVKFSWIKLIHRRACCRNSLSRKSLNSVSVIVGLKRVRF